jgi:hypothetical protein
MALAYSTSIRDNRLTQIANAAGTGALIRIYDGARPATGGTATTLLAELTVAGAFGSVSGQVLTVGTVTQDSSANATGTATWFRVVTSGAAFVMDGNVGTSGSDLNLNSTSINTGVAVAISSFTITAGNA